MNLLEKIKQRNIIFTIMATLNIAIPLILGYILNNMTLGAIGAFGSLSFMYYIPQNNYHGLRNVAIYSVSIVIFFFIALLLSSYKLITPIYIGLIGTLVVYFTKRFNIIGPGPFFLLMIVSMAASLNIESLQTKMNMTFYLSIGLFISVIMALLSDYVSIKYKIHKLHTLSFNEVKNIYPKTPNLLILKSLHYGITIFFAFYLAMNLNLTNYYWVVVACAAVLQGDDFKHAFTRFYQYILGAIGGVLLALIITSISLTSSQIIIVVIVLMFFIDLLITHNYILGNIFTTPIAIIIIKIIFPSLNNTVIVYRFSNIIIGTCLALFSMYLLHKIINNIEIKDKI